MPRFRSPFICAILLLASCVRPAPSLNTELGELLEALPGVYVGMAPKALSPDGTMQKLVHTFAAIDAAQFGEKTLYYQVSAENAAGPVLQAKIFVFDVQSGRQSNIMRAFILDTAQAGNGLHADAARLAALNPSELMSFPEDCFFSWGRVSEGFVGTGSATCTYPSRAFKQRIRPEMTYRILGDRFEWEEALYGEDGSAVVTTNGTLTAFRK
jgi:hypothetical protein